MTTAKDDRCTDLSKTHYRVRIKRQGYKRKQRYGPGNSLVKHIKVKPYFVYVWKAKSENYELMF